MEFNFLKNLSNENFYNPQKIFQNLDNLMNLNNNSKDNKYYKSIVLFLVIFICYILYTIKTQIVPGLLFAFIIASLIHLNRKKIKKQIKKYNLYKIPYIKNII